jgi:hypothetical protein
VKRVRDGHGRGGGVGKRDRLGHALADPLGSDPLDQLFAERPLRFDCDDVEAESEQRACQLPGAGREVEHPVSRSDLQLGRQRPDHRRRVFGPAALVRVGDGPELLGEGVKVHERSVESGVRVYSRGRGHHRASLHAPQHP